MPSYKNIVVCSDFSANSDKAFAAAVDMAAESGGKVTVLHVVPASFDYGRMELASPEAHTLGNVSKVEDRMRERYAAKTSVPVDVVLDYGSEGDRIVEYADEKGADLIVMGARGVGFLVGLLGGGSVVNKVVKNTKTPVLVVPA